MRGIMGLLVVLIVIGLIGCSKKSGVTTPEPGLPLPTSRFTTETVDSTGWKGFGLPSLALDAAGNPKIVYWDQNSQLYRFASRDTAGWHVEGGIPYTSNDGHSSLALDALGVPHVTYAGAGLDYAVKTGAIWNTETIDINASIYTSSVQNALALDSSGNPEVIYLNGSGKLMYAFKSGGTWNSVFLESPVSYMSFVRDAQGRKHIAYINSDNGGLYYMTPVNGVWARTIVDTTANSPSIAVDSEGVPRICYYSDNSLGVKLAQRSDSTWGSTWNVSSVGRGNWPCLRVDALGRSGVIYGTTQGNYELLNYATESAGTWSIEMVATPAAYLGSLALDAQWAPHVAYLPSYPPVLKYASLGP